MASVTRIPAVAACVARPFFRSPVYLLGSTNGIGEYRCGWFPLTCFNSVSCMGTLQRSRAHERHLLHGGKSGLNQLNDKFTNIIPGLAARDIVVVKYPGRQFGERTVLFHQSPNIGADLVEGKNRVESSHFALCGHNHRLAGNFTRDHTYTAPELGIFGESQ